MRESYDFSKGVKNPYAERLRNQVTIILDPETADYFRAQAEHAGVPYQNLINQYLADCAMKKRKLAGNRE